MIDRVTVVEGPCDRLRRVDAGRERPYAAGRSRRVECGKGAVAGPDEDPVITAERVSRDEREIGSVITPFSSMSRSGPKEYGAKTWIWPGGSNVVNVPLLARKKP
jgi:hypothetical protein